MKSWQTIDFPEWVLKTHQILSVWIFTDVIFAVIPIVTIACINGLLGTGFHDFLFIKEWSFASIVIFGVCIRKTIRLKVEIQQDVDSYRLDTMVQIIILCLILSVLILSFVLLGEKGVIAKQETIVVGVAQFALFFMGLFVMLLTTMAEDQYYSDTYDLPDGISRYWLLKRILSKVERASDCINYVAYASQRASILKFAKPKNELLSCCDDQHLYLRLHDLIEQVEQSLSETKRQLNSLKVSQVSSATAGN